MSGLEGTTLGRYQLLQQLGEGGMAEVYLAYDGLMNRNVAIKVHSGNHATLVARFHREAEAIGQLNHAHILPAFDYGEQQPWRYLVMPYIEHGTLWERLTDEPLSPEAAGEILLQLAGALQCAHNHGIIHRDIKPSNILFRDDHYIYLADFGLAKSLEDTRYITQSGALLGTAEYMAPDLAKGPATISSDIYALGVVLYQMVTGHVPFNADTPLAVYMKHLHEQPVAPSLLNPTLPHTLDKVILHALEKEPRRRFKSAHALASAYMRTLVAARRQEEKQLKAQQALSLQAASVPAAAQGGKRSSLSRRPFAALARGRVLVLSEPAMAAMAEGITNATDATNGALLTEPIVPSPSPKSLAQNLQLPLPGQHPAFSPYRHVQQVRTRALSIVAIGVLLLILLPLLSLYYFYTTAHRPAIVTTAISGSSSSSAHAAPTSVGTTPIFTDPLTNNAAGRWTTNSTCLFSASSYHINVTQTDFLQPCPLLTAVPAQMKVQVQVVLLSGHDAGMLLNLQGNHFYDFEITAQGQFFFRRHDNATGAIYTNLIPPTVSSAVAPQGEQNTLTVIAHSGTFQLFINSTFIGEVQDTTYTDGTLALAAGTLSPQTSGEAAFSNFALFQQ